MKVFTRCVTWQYPRNCSRTSSIGTMNPVIWCMSMKHPLGPYMTTSRALSSATLRIEPNSEHFGETESCRSRSSAVGRDPSSGTVPFVSGGRSTATRPTTTLAITANHLAHRREDARPHCLIELTMEDRKGLAFFPQSDRFV